MNPQPDYASLTRADPNPVKRWLQARRLHDAVRMLGALSPVRIVDYGAGDGQLVHLLRQRLPDSEIICFEPSAQLFAQAQAHTAGLSGVKLTDDIAAVPDACADAIFCLEVFEHLPPQETQDAIAQMHRLLKTDGVLIVGVPVEIGAAALVKGGFRRLRRRDFDTDAARVVRAAVGQTDFARHKVEFAPGLSYFPHHLGFDHRRLERVLSERFRLRRRRSSPLGWLPVTCNSELNLLLTKT